YRGMGEKPTRPARRPSRPRARMIAPSSMSMAVVLCTGVCPPWGGCGGGVCAPGRCRSRAGGAGWWPVAPVGGWAVGRTGRHGVAARGGGAEGRGLSVLARTARRAGGRRVAVLSGEGGRKRGGPGPAGSAGGGGEGSARCAAEGAAHDAAGIGEAVAGGV